jgi:tetratricopeptide (TPR) repeat protein
MRKFIAFLVLGALAAGFTYAQQAPAASGSPVAPQPKPKSQEEFTALQAIFSAPDADGRIKAAENLITKFGDTEYKSVAMTVIASSYEQKGDSDNAIVWSEKTLEVDPHSFQAKLTIATELARKTREHDLDRDEKLGRADSLLKSAQEDIQAALRPRADVTDEQWGGFKKMLMAQSYEVAGMIALARKNFDLAAENFKKALTGNPQTDPGTQVRLANVYNLQGKSAEAIAVLDQVLAAPALHPQIKAAAEAEKAKATNAKK